MPNQKHFRYSKGIDIGHNKITEDDIKNKGSSWFEKLSKGNQKRVARFDHLAQRQQKFGSLNPSEKTMEKALKNKQK